MFREICNFFRFMCYDCCWLNTTTAEEKKTVDLFSTFPSRNWETCFDNIGNKPPLKNFSVEKKPIGHFLRLALENGSIVPMTLHIMLGIGNLVFQEIESLGIIIKKENSEEDVSLTDYWKFFKLFFHISRIKYKFLNNFYWLKKTNAKRSKYHGGMMEGPNVRKLLRNLVFLKQYFDKDVRLKPLYQILYRFNKIRTWTFTKGRPTQKLIDAVSRETIKLVEAWKTSSLYPSHFPPKLHILVNHLVTFMGRENILPGTVSEQDIESAHSKFMQFFKNYMNKGFRGLLGAVREWNSLRF